MGSHLTRVHALPGGRGCTAGIPRLLLLSPDLGQLPRSVEKQVGGVPVPAPTELEHILLVHGAHVIIVTLEPGLTLLPHPAHVVTAATGPALVCQHGLELMIYI